MHLEHPLYCNQLACWKNHAIDPLVVEEEGAEIQVQVLHLHLIHLVKLLLATILLGLIILLLLLQLQELELLYLLFLTLLNGVTPQTATGLQLPLLLDLVGMISSHPIPSLPPARRRRNKNHPPHPPTDQTQPTLYPIGPLNLRVTTAC